MLAWSLWLATFGCCAAGLIVTLVVTRPITTAVLAEGALYVDRDQVYALGDYDADRKLTGFTRPVSRVVRVLQERGLVPDDAIADVRSPVYDPEIKSFQRAAGFRVPQELLPLIRGD
jgi:hypothetical protein